MKHDTYEFSPSIVLQFEKDCAHNTTIVRLGKGPALRYVVQSDKYVKATRVSQSIDGSDPTVVGVIQRRSFLPDTLSVDGIDTRLSHMLKTPVFDDL